MNCVVVGFIADMELAEKKGVTGLDKVRLATAEEMAGVSWGPSLLWDFNIYIYTYIHIYIYILKTMTNYTITCWLLFEDHQL